MGATMRGDGQSCLSWPSNVSSTSVEISEHIAPLRFHHKRLRAGQRRRRHASRRPGTGDPGRKPAPTRPIAVSFLAERTIFPAFGIHGGAAGAPGDAAHQRRRGGPEAAIHPAARRHASCWRRPAVAATAIRRHATPRRCMPIGARGMCRTPQPGDLHDPPPHLAVGHARHHRRRECPRRRDGEDRRAVPVDRQFGCLGPGGQAVGGNRRRDRQHRPSRVEGHADRYQPGPASPRRREDRADLRRSPRRSLGRAKPGPAADHQRQGRRAAGFLPIVHRDDRDGGGGTLRRALRGERFGRQQHHHARLQVHLPRHPDRAELRRELHAVPHDDEAVGQGGRYASPSSTRTPITAPRSATRSRRRRSRPACRWRSAFPTAPTAPT